MKFEVVNDMGITVMNTSIAYCIPENDDLISMSKAGYKFKIDGKNVSIKKIKETISNISNL